MKKYTLFLIFSITLASALGLASVTPALPKIAAGLNVEENKIGLVFTIFALPSLILTPLFGFLADIIGRKKVLVPSLILFSLSGFACFFAKDFNTLLILRFIEGCAASSLGALNVTLIGDIYKDSQRTRIMGLNNSVLSIGTALFPIIGGALAKINWNYIFIVPLFALPIGLMVIKYLDNNFIYNKVSLKVYFKNIWKEFAKIKIIGLLSISSLCFIILFGAFLTYTPFILANKFNVDSFNIGIVIASMSIFQALISFNLGKISLILKNRYILLLAMILYFASLTLIPLYNNIYLIFISTSLFGIAHGLAIPTVQSILAGKFDISQRAAFMSLNRMVAQLGQAMGPFLMGVVLFNFGLNYVFQFAALLALIMFIILFIYTRRRIL